MKDLQKLFNECMEEAKAIGIEVGEIVEAKENKRYTSKWGNCTRNRETNTFTIQISSRLLVDAVSDEATKNTIMHEILHTCKNCFNHGVQWKNKANLVSDCYSFYNITRLTSSEEKGIKVNDDDYKYIFVCEKCGQKVRRKSSSKFVKHPEFYHCGKCKGKFKRIK